ncbi:hypothetical protein L1887_55568 [Cichorium endivia]|nr:hypothetical protein L1887_55568 [Cichorium endivia]
MLARVHKDVTAITHPESRYTELLHVFEQWVAGAEGTMAGGARGFVEGLPGSGIGHALAREFKSKGFRVFATARKTESIADLAALGIEALALEATGSESIEALKAEIYVPGPVASWTTSSTTPAAATQCPAVEVEMHEIEQTFAVNVFAVMRMCQAFAPLLIEARGTIVQIGSLAGEMPYVFASVYCASKGALHQYTDTAEAGAQAFRGSGSSMSSRAASRVKSPATFRMLRDDSIYMPVQKDFERRLTHSQSLGMETEVYAKRVVAQLTGWRRKETIWLRETAMMRMFGLTKLRAINEKKKLGLS